jgi:hypothetical protein
MALLVGIGLATAQGERGSINGVVVDKSGATVPGAAVTATMVSTGVQTKTITTTAGVFRFVALPPGTYSVEVTKQGFRKMVQEGIQLRVAETLELNFGLEVGSEVQTVTVSGGATVDVSPGAGTYVNNQDLNTWPIELSSDEHRDIQQFVFQSLPGTEGGTFEGTINGSQAYSQEVLVDGISEGRYDIPGDTAEMTPTYASISQFKLQTGAMGAQFDDAATGVVNYNIQSGTNTLHGQLYSFIQNEAFDANGYDNNAEGIPKSPRRTTEYGGAAGGPIYIPHVYNGKDKAFWFFSFEKNKFENFGRGGFLTLPTAAMKQGDFSGLFNPSFTGNALSGTQIGTDALGRPVLYGQIYNPATTQLVNGVEVRDPYNGNIISPTAFTTVSNNYLALLPNPTYASLFDNEPTLSSGSPLQTEEIATTKEDYNFSTKQRVTFMFNYNGRLNNKSDNSYGGYRGWSTPPGGSPLDQWETQKTPSWMVRVHDIWTISPSLLNDFAFGNNRFDNFDTSYYYDQGWAQKLGILNTSPATPPEMYFAGAPVLGGTVDTMGSDPLYIYNNGSSVIQDQLTWIHGKHQFSFGTQDYFYYGNDINVTDSGEDEFLPRQTQLTNFSGETGNAFASFLLGQVGTSSHFIGGPNGANTTIGNKQREYGFYASDSWKVTSKFQLELGLRWSVIPGQTEVFGRMSSMNPDLPNPGAGNIDGALQFANVLHENTFIATQWGQVEPRFGFAYAVKPRIVVRGGYGINHAPPLDTYFTPSTFGYTATMSLSPATVSLPYPDAAVLTLSQPYPSYPGTIPDTDPSSGNGSYVTYIAPQSGTVNWIQNYNLGLQFLLGGNSTLDVSYVGNVGQRLDDYTWSNMNQQPVSALLYGNALLEPLSQNPGLAPLPYAGFNSTLAQALTPYPQYAGVTYESPFWGVSEYNSLQVQLNKRFSNGLTLMAAYTYSKVLTNVTAGGGFTPQNVYDRTVERGPGDYNVPQDLRLTWSYNLPFGAKRTFKLTGVKDKILGGWTVSGLQAYRSGDVLGVTESNFDDPLSNTIYPDVVAKQSVILNGSAPVNLEGASTSLARFVNPAAFSDVPTTSEGVPLRLGTAPRYEPASRGPAWATESFNLFKDIHFLKNEATYLRVRTDWINAFNRTGRADPVTNIDSPLFGEITDVQQGPRLIQLSMQLFF